MTTEHLEKPAWCDEITVPDREQLSLYISGPMRNIPKTNFPMFDACRDHLEALGHHAISPADNDRQVDPLVETRTGWLEGKPDEDSPLNFTELMVWDIDQIIHADGIVLLPGWEHSTGAAYELSAARGTGKRVFYFTPRDGMLRIEAYITEEQQPTVIGISGYAQAGKDTIGSVLTESAGFVRVAFADALREVLYALNPSVCVQTGPSFVDFLWTTVVDVVEDKGWEWAKANSDVRGYLQRLGTEAGRQILGDDIWVRTAMAKVNGGKYVFTDVRFPNEARAILDKGGQVWRVERPGVAPVNPHPSETALDDWPFDLVIFNKGTLDDLREQVSIALG